MNTSRRGFLRAAAGAALTIPVLGTGTTMATASKIAVDKPTALHQLVVRNVPRHSSLGVWMLDGKKLFLDQGDFGPTQRLYVANELRGEEVMVRCRKPGMIPFEAVTVLSGPLTEINVCVVEDRLYGEDE